MLVGFGLTDCLRDILDGEVDRADVRYIFRGGTGRTPCGTVDPLDHREKYIEYVKSLADCWNWDKEEAVRLATKFWDEGKILHSNGLQPDAYKHWFDVDEEIPCRFHWRY